MLSIAISRVVQSSSLVLSVHSGIVTVIAPLSQGAVPPVTSISNVPAASPSCAVYVPAVASQFAKSTPPVAFDTAPNVKSGQLDAVTTVIQLPSAGGVTSANG